MSSNEMESKVRELRELKRMQEEINAEIETLTDAIKAEMTARNTDTLTGSDWKASWKEVTTNRLDTAALKKAMPRYCSRIYKSKHKPPFHSCLKNALSKAGTLKKASATSNPTKGAVTI